MYKRQVHYLGDAVALVAAKDRETVEKAKKLIKVDYEVLPHVHTIEEAAALDAPKVFDEEDSNVCAHKHISRGNAEEAIRNSKYVISHHFETPWTEHAFLEPECAVAFYDEDGDVFIYSADQSAHQTRHECSLLLGTDKVKVQNALVGGCLLYTSQMRSFRKQHLIREKRNFIRNIWERSISFWELWQIR